MNNLNLPLVNWLDEHLTEENAKREKKEQTTWHASSLGGCLRGVYLKRLGVEPDKEFDAKTLRIFKLGRIIEDFYRDILKEKVHLKEEVYVRDEKELGVSGYIDALVSHNGDKEILEIKSINTNSFNWMVKKGEGAKIGHKMQLWIYLHLAKVDQGRIVYIEKNFMNIAEFIVKREDKELENLVRGTLATLQGAWDAKDISLIPLVDDKDWRARYCSYHKQCKKVGLETKTKLI